MNYESFAYLYDTLMDEAPYDKWLQFFLEKTKLYTEDCKRVLDLACGTGELTIKFFEKGYEVSGVDLSEDMLAVANKKAIDKGYQIPFFQQDMTSLEGLNHFDAVVIFCDSLNYLADENQVKDTFSSVYQVLQEGGLFLFDVHSSYKIESIYANETFAYNGDEISYIWNSFPGTEELSIEHELTFFVLDETTNQYTRYDEFHRQRTFPIAVYKDWLEKAGFEVLAMEADFSDQQITEESERIFFTARKK